MLQAAHTFEASQCRTSDLRFPGFVPFRGALATGLSEIDQALGGGLHAGVHEWYGLHEARRQEATNPRKNESRQQNQQSTINNRQRVPFCLLVHLAWQALEANPSQWVIWVGPSCFPYPAVLVRDSGRDLRLLRRSLFVRAESLADRLWVTDLSIRCGLSGAVIADGAGLDMAATRRVQLSARSRGAFVFLARPPQDLDRLSAATTRWLVRPGGMARRSAAMPAFSCGELVHAARDLALTPAPLRRGEGERRPQTHNPQWSLELLRCKGMQPSTSRRAWLVEWNRAANVIRVPAPLCDSFVEHRHEATKARRHGG